MARTKQEELDLASDHYYFSKQHVGIDNRCREFMIARCLPHVRPGPVLELGFMDGQWTEHFLRLGCRVTVVEGARRNIEFGKNRYRNDPRVQFVHSLFEDYAASEKFQTIHVGGVLKHLADPDALLRRIRGWMTDGSVLITTTPNARSLHRRVGVHMGMLAHLNALSETDVQVGNLRHYDLASFRGLLEGAGFQVRELRSAMLKPVSSRQMEDWDDGVLSALDRVADEIPDYGWYIYAICALK
jgi:2-polyprenyl-3-methyl-5-hydroxy-6-metoxy-1,4-benzoquinol methylase